MSLATSDHLRFVTSIADLDPAAWNRVAGQQYPFLRHEFLWALESSGCTTAATGWQPQHLVVEDEHGTLKALLPLYLKTHSMGEYVFDWNWADAYQRHGLDYYPKLLSATPFTPCAGPRLCLAEGEDVAARSQQLVHAVQDRMSELGASSWHLLFPESEAKDRLQQQGLLVRTGCQYQWFNNGYGSFDDYLATFASRKRKTLRKERQTVSAAGVQLQVIEGPDLSAAHWQDFYRFYANTYVVRGRRPYLNAEFFQRIGQSMANQLMMVVATLGNEAIAGALFFKGQDTLFGRYWGASAEFSCLHFEACYYQGIDYCIRHGYQRMDSGAQGEHKIQRGFAPVPTWSLHWIAHPEFRRAIGSYVAEEQSHIHHYMAQATELLPFRKDLVL